MTGTFSFCKTNEAWKRVDDGDIVQHLNSEMYYKKDSKGIVYQSLNLSNWTECYGIPLFDLNDDWRSLSNLHYYHDLKSMASGSLMFLTIDDQVIDEHHPTSDKEKKRWFVGGILN